jgi:hypothetical protein
MNHWALIPAGLLRSAGLDSDLELRIARRRVRRAGSTQTRIECLVSAAARVVQRFHYPERVGELLRRLYG